MNKIKLDPTYFDTSNLVTSYRSLLILGIDKYYTKRKQNPSNF